MKSKFVKGLLATFMVMTRGVGDIALVTGRVFYNNSQESNLKQVR